MAVKYAGDVVLVWLLAHRIWTPADYIESSLSLSSAFPTQGASGWMLPLLGVWTLPFAWIGVSMSTRRAMDAGRSGWLSVLFFVPYVNWLLMLALSVMPGRSELRAGAPRAFNSIARALILGVLAGTLAGVTLLSFGVFVVATYGASIFLGTPFLIGAITGFVLNRMRPSTRASTMLAATASLTMIGAVALVIAAEGAVCLAMAYPLALGMGIFGADIGRSIALLDRGSPVNAMLAMMMMPATATLGSVRAPTELREVRSAIEIDAPADSVWRHVVDFPPLPEPSELLFRLGIAYPRYARLEGTGVGAVRYCVFSTGAFVEPITAWEPGRRLAFDVSEQPRALRELSPYADVVPPHLDGYFRSRRGEFRLVALPGNRTRLEGSTWYEMKIFPEAYWTIFADLVVGRIHQRVLTHIRTVSESGSRLSPVAGTGDSIPPASAPGRPPREEGS